MGALDPAATHYYVFPIKDSTLSGRNRALGIIELNDNLPALDRNVAGRGSTDLI
jgi:hypothetical protein